MKRQSLDRIVLFIYDNTDTLELFKRDYLAYGYNVQTAQNGNEAKSIIKDLFPQVIVSDIYLDSSHQWVEELISYVNKVSPASKIILTSDWAGFDSYSEKYSEISNKVFDIHFKPILADELGSSIRQAFNLSKSVNRFSMITHPIWRSREFQTKSNTCFVLMPFSQRWSTRIWEHHLKPIISNCGLVPLRGDDFTGHDIMEDIWIGINEAKVVIAEITGKNPNVFYELGIAHTLGKDVILITQNMKDIPFDLNRYRIIEYEDNSDGYDKLKRLLTKFILAIDNSSSSIAS